MFKRIVIIAFLLASAVSSVTAKPVFVIYTGIAMVQPIEILSKKIESEYDVKVRVIKSGNSIQYKAIIKSQNGDLFLPGSDSFIKKLKKEHPGFVVDEVQVGENRVAFTVKKGNPKNIPLNLASLQNCNYRIMIGSEKIGAVGRITKAILKDNGIHEKVHRVTKTKSHTKGLLNAIKKDKADLTLNWYAVSTWSQNKNFMEATPVPTTVAKPIKLVLPQLSSSKNPKITKTFLELAASEEGKKLFKKWEFAYKVFC